MTYALICIPLMWFGSDLLVTYGTELTIIDTILFIASTIHIVKHNKSYFKYQTNCYYGCLMYLFLERTDLVFHFNGMVYFSLYVAIFLVVLGKCIKDNLNENFKRHLTK